jgi:hypothetical protein
MQIKSPSAAFPSSRSKALCKITNEREGGRCGDRGCDLLDPGTEQLALQNMQSAAGIAQLWHNDWEDVAHEVLLRISDALLAGESDCGRFRQQMQRLSASGHVLCKRSPVTRRLSSGAVETYN